MSKLLTLKECLEEAGSFPFVVRNKDESTSWMLVGQKYNDLNSFIAIGTYHNSGSIYEYVNGNVTFKNDYPHYKWTLVDYFDGVQAIDYNKAPAVIEIPDCNCDDESKHVKACECRKWAGIKYLNMGNKYEVWFKKEGTI